MSWEELEPDWQKTWLYSLCVLRGQRCEKTCIHCCTDTHWVAAACLPDPNRHQASLRWMAWVKINLSCFKLSHKVVTMTQEELRSIIAFKKKKESKCVWEDYFFKSILLQKPGTLGSEREVGTQHRFFFLPLHGSPWTLEFRKLLWRCSVIIATSVVHCLLSATMWQTPHLGFLILRL